MSLRIGSTLGPYEVVAPIGHGGMGEVYRARDRRLGRDVALKILADPFAHDPDRLARFQREAEILASLNHPNIAAIYGIEDDNGVTALVLELVEGPTLADIQPSRLPVDDALRLAEQIAAALEAAHDRGIVHRDLKPSNVAVVAASGGAGRPVLRSASVKVLDFGLARLSEVSASGSQAGGGSPTISPTISSPALLTGKGTILGTAAYMAPEQARGEPVNHQADIWAFGCVLFEMLTGRRVFDGRSVSDVIAEILRGGPDWTALPGDLHPRIRLLLERCLEKDVTRRYHHIADARIDIQAVLAGAAMPARHDADAGRRPWKRRVPVWAALAAGLTAVGAGFAAWTLKPAAVRPVHRFAHVLSFGQSFTQTGQRLVAVAPDGSSIVYVANGSLIWRSLDRFEAAPIPGTQGAPANPFFSPDGQSLGYHEFRKGELRRIALTGGTPVTIAAVTNLFGARWEADGTILYGQEDGIWRVPAGGGVPEPLLRIEPGERIHAPQLLPDRKTLLFTVRRGAGSAGWESAQIVVQSLAAGSRRIVVANGSDGRYLPTGHLVYGASGALLAVPFDAAKAEPYGAAVPLVPSVRPPVRFPGTTGTANYDIAADGTLVYVAGGARGPVPRELVVVDRTGKATPLIADKRDYWRPRITPDGARIVTEVGDSRGDQLWVIDPRGGTATALTLDGTLNNFAAIGPDGRSVLFRSDRSAAPGIYGQPVDGSGPARLLHRADEVFPGNVSPDGVLVFAQGEQTGRRSISTMRLEDGHVTEFLATPAMEHMPAFSPDGKWIAYASNESGREEVYIRAFPAGDAAVRRVTDAGGTAPVWAADGSELFYRNAAGYLMAVPVRLGAAVTLGRAQQLFAVIGKFKTSGNAAAYDVEPGGRGFIMVTEPDQRPADVQQINIVLNWFSELRQRVPVR